MHVDGSTYEGELGSQTGFRVEGLGFRRVLVRAPLSDPLRVQGLGCLYGV